MLPLAEADEILKLGELWSFVGCKAQVRWPCVGLLRLRAKRNSHSHTRWESAVRLTAYPPHFLWWRRVLALALPGRLLSGIMAALVVSACQESFSPIEPSALQFSVYGYLDASADTQWIRVMPMRPAALTTPDPLDAVVTVENLGTGQIIQLRDSVFRFTGNPDVGSDGVFLHNYLTTERIEPGATYRFSAARDGGPPSEAVVQIPPDFQVTEVWLRQARTDGPDLVWIDGVKHVPFVGVENHFYDSCGPGVERLFNLVAPRDPGDHSVPAARWFEGRKDEGCTRPAVERREVLVVGSEAEWPSGVEYGTGRLGLSDPPSNISNSMGFIGGVLIKSLPYENCEVESVPPSADYCRLRYDASSVTLRGVVTDTTCGHQRVPGADVRLREIDPPPGAPRRIRFTLSSHTGEYEIGALEAGKRYALSVRGPQLPDEIGDSYEEHRDTLAFTPGEVVTRNFGIRRLVSCSKKF